MAVLMPYATDMATDGVGGVMRHLRDLLLDLAAYLLSETGRLRLHDAGGLLDRRVLCCLAGELDDLVVLLPASSRADDVAGGEPGNERHSIHTHLDLSRAA
jgi:hypothetical protein